MQRFLIALCVCFTVTTNAYALDCTTITYKTISYSVCTVDKETDDLRLFLKDRDNNVIGQFSTLNRTLTEEGQRLSFAMNAGMYHADRSPVGLYIENETEVMGLVPNPGPGNFGMVPNGVFCISKDRFDVTETLAFQEAAPKCTHATQSGPMLVIDGKLHPRFLEHSSSRYVRNGVGILNDGKTALFIISNSPVTFWEFASVFREKYNVQNALYFDGNISRIYAPSLNRYDYGLRMGPIVGVVEKE